MSRLDSWVFPETSAALLLARPIVPPEKKNFNYFNTVFG
jgi:hypothetical protein